MRATISGRRTFSRWASSVSRAFCPAAVMWTDRMATRGFLAVRPRGGRRGDWGEARDSTGRGAPAEPPGGRGSAAPPPPPRQGDEDEHSAGGESREGGAIA